MSDKASPKKRGNSDGDMVGDGDADNEGLPIEGIQHPGGKDVMFGRGGETNYHIGNTRFRLQADEYRKRYREASRQEKSVVVQELIDSWRAEGGRFLARSDPSKGEESVWHDVGDEMALKKAAKILTEKQPQDQGSRKRQARRASSTGPPQRQRQIGQQAVAPSAASYPSAAALAQPGYQQGQVFQQGPPNPNQPIGTGNSVQMMMQRDAAIAARYGYVAAALPPALASLQQDPNTFPAMAAGQRGGGSAGESVLPVVALQMGPAQAFASLYMRQQGAAETGGSGAVAACVGEGSGSGRASRPQQNQESPENQSDDSPPAAPGEAANIPTAAFLSGVFSSSSSEKPSNGDSSPSTDDSKG